MSWKSGDYVPKEEVISKEVKVPRKRNDEIILKCMADGKWHDAEDLQNFMEIELGKKIRLTVIDMEMQKLVEKNLVIEEEESSWQIKKN